MGGDGIAGTKDDRNEFNASYYSTNGLSVDSNTSETDENILEFANYQSLYGKDYYVILRPSLSIDLIGMDLDVNYSTLNQTNKDVTVTITSNEKMIDVDGWTLSEDELTLTKVYKENTTEEVEICDYLGNKITKTIKINNIDKVAPTAQVNYSTTELTNNSVTITITANERIQQIEGWTIDSKQKILTKIFTANDEETVTITDLAGNTSTIDVKVANIDKTEIEADVKYSTTIWTNKDVIVTITLNKLIKEIENWNLSEDGKTLTKIFTSNEENEFDVQDLAGNTKKLKVRVANIDKMAPTIEVSYSITSVTNNDVIATITANEEIQEIEGWSLSVDGKVLTKTYSTNKEETITVQDLAGNTTVANIKITNIDKGNSKSDANNDSENKKDTTTTKELLPKTGEDKILIIGGIFIAVGLASFMVGTLKRYRDIK